MGGLCNCPGLTPRKPTLPMRNDLLTGIQGGCVKGVTGQEVRRGPGKELRCHNAGRWRRADPGLPRAFPGVQREDRGRSRRGRCSESGTFRGLSGRLRKH